MTPGQIGMGSVVSLRRTAPPDANENRCGKTQDDDGLLPQPTVEEAARATTDAITHRHAALHVNPSTVSTVSQQL